MLELSFYLLVFKLLRFISHSPTLCNELLSLVFHYHYEPMMLNIFVMYIYKYFKITIFMRFKLLFFWAAVASSIWSLNPFGMSFLFLEIPSVFGMTNLGICAVWNLQLELDSSIPDSFIWEVLSQKSQSKHQWCSNLVA